MPKFKMGKGANVITNEGGKSTKPKRKTIGGGSVSKNIGLKSKPLTLRQAALRNPVKRGR